jgi:hypothetical protein
MREWRHKSKIVDLSAYRKRERFSNLSAKYGISIEEYERLLKRQNGRCAICKSPPVNGRGKTLQVDHDHATGRIRGLLCHGCNAGIGNFCESLSNIIAAAAYLAANVTEAPAQGDEFVIT